MKALGVIPARMGSKGLPGKNVKELLGKPLIVYAFEAALAATSLDRLVVTTDDPVVEKLADSYGIQQIRRPSHLCQDASPLELALRHTLITLEEGEGYQPDLVVQIYPNIPLRREGDIDRAVALARESKADSVISVVEVKNHPEWMKRIVDGKLVPYTETRAFNRQQLEPLYAPNGSIIITRAEVLLAGTEGEITPDRYLGKDIRAYVQEPLYSVDVDTMWDFLWAEFLMKRFSAGITSEGSPSPEVKQPI